MKQRKHRWIWILVILYIYFIFSNSFMSANASNHMSYGVTYKIMNVLEYFGLTADFDIFHHYIRKLAHFSEFALLGFLINISIHISPLLKNKFINFCIFWLGVPFADEMIQKLSDGRSSQFTDMVIDASGFLFGAFIAYIFVLIIKDLFFKQKQI